MAKTKALISFAVTVKLICFFVFAYAKSRFSHDAAQLIYQYDVHFSHDLKHRGNIIGPICDVNQVNHIPYMQKHAVKQVH